MQKNESLCINFRMIKNRFWWRGFVCLLTDGMMTQKQTSIERWIVFESLHCYAYWLLIEVEYKTFALCRFFALRFPTVVLKFFILPFQSIVSMQKKHHELTDNVLSPMNTHGKPNAINVWVFLNLMLSKYYCWFRFAVQQIMSQSSFALHFNEKDNVKS